MANSFHLYQLDPCWVHRVLILEPARVHSFSSYKPRVDNVGNEAGFIKGSFRPVEQIRVDWSPVRLGFGLGFGLGLA